jgi:phenylalanyl-tRNA synthetase beta chain
MIGMARETGAVLGKPVDVELPELVEEGQRAAADLVSVQIEDPERCQRYVARVVSGVKIGPSPEWLARRVTAAGSRPINNVVDVTNYVMYLTGQPLHAFDLGKLSRGEDGRARIVVRAAREGEKLTTLDGKERALTPDMTLITDDGATPVALAGVMGGLDSEIDDTTVDVLLESAAFSNAHTSRTSRNLQLFSEAAMRYERVVDPAGCAWVADVAAALFAEVCGGTVAQGAVDVYPQPAEPAVLPLRCERLRAMMGAPITDDFIATSLRRLGCSVVETGVEHELTVTAPTFRPDLVREIDLYEEVVRLWGEGDIEPTLPAPRNHRGGLTPEQVRRRRIGATLRACGLNETICYAFVPEDDLERLRMSEEGRGEAVRLMRPMSSDWTVMRRTLIPGLLRSVATNLKHGVGNVALYETGRLYFGRPGHAQPKERPAVAGVLAGKWDDDAWNATYPELDFFDAKGVVETLLADLRIEKVRFKAADPAAFGFAQPGRAAEVLAGGTVLGWVAQLHPTALAAFDVDVPVAAFELDLEQLVRLGKAELPYRDVPTLPAVSLDLALTVDEAVTCERLEQVITSAGGKVLESVRLFDVFRDPVRVGAGKKSMAFSLTYRAADHTLTSEEAEAAHRRVVDKVCRATGAAQRG